MQVYLTVRSNTKRIPGQIIHYAQVHDLNDRIIVSATLDYVLAVAQQRGYEFVGENPAERKRQEAARRESLLRRFVHFDGPVLNDTGRDYDSEAALADYQREIEA
jgi:hypothetical protein